MLTRSPLVLALMTALTVSAGGTGRADAGSFTLANGYVRLGGEGTHLTELCFDAGGRGRFGKSLLGRLEFRGLEPRPECAWTRTGDEILVSGAELVTADEVSIPNGGQPEMLPIGHTLGQSFTVSEGSFDAVAAPVPTWQASTSAVTLRLRRDGPEGEIVASTRLEDIPDNSQQRLAFPRQPAGAYYLEMLDPVGSVGWWGSPQDVYAGGTAFVDGLPVPGRERSLKASLRRVVGPARLRLALEGPQLRMTAEVRDAPAAVNAPIVMQVPWDNTGYEVSARSVPFFRFFTDNQRYLPAEQFKRATSPGLGFGPCAWMEADGTGDYDLRFSGDQLQVNWDMQPDSASFHLQPRSRPGSEGMRTISLSLTVRPREDTLPADWPAFETPDATLTRDLNRFFYERAFSYPAPSGPAAWLEWSALIRYWFAGPLRDGEVAGVTGTQVDEEGYVYTWGGNRGWPFPDNSLFDTRHFDTNARFLLACWRYACWSRDEVFLRSQAERMRRAMDYQLTTLRGAEGLIITASQDVTGRHQGVGNNYWDILPFGHLDAYANVVYYASLEAMAQLETLLEKLPGLETTAPRRSPQEYRHLAERVREAYNRTFWEDQAGRYIGCVDVDGQPHDYGFTFVNLEAMAYGLASPEQARRIYDWLEHGD